MCQATLGNPCDRCGGGYSMGLDNYCPHAPWCGDDEEVKRQTEIRLAKRKADFENGLDW